MNVIWELDQDNTIESLRTNKDETINLKVNFDRNWKNW